MSRQPDWWGWLPEEWAHMHRLYQDTGEVVDRLAAAWKIPPTTVLTTAYRLNLPTTGATQWGEPGNGPGPADSARRAYLPVRRRPCRL